MSRSIAIPDEVVLKRIFLIRGQKVMLDMDLAGLYGVETKQFKRAVRRNSGRFPDDFMFALTKKEWDDLRCQNGTSSWGGVRYKVIRIFTRLRAMILTHKDILLKLEQLEGKVIHHGVDIQLIFDYLKELLNPRRHP